MENIQVLRIDNDYPAPFYASNGAVGFDFHVKSVVSVYDSETGQEIPYSYGFDVDKLIETVNIPPFSQVLFATYESFIIPEGYEVQIRPRSGVSLKRGLMVNLGTIDHDYRGDIGIIVLNHTPFVKKVEIGERLAQGVLSKIEKADFLTISKEMFNEYETERGTGGFGHTGK